MKNKTLINQENGNDANRLLCADWRTVDERPEWIMIDRNGKPSIISEGIWE